MQTVELQLLTQGRALIADRNNWIQGEMAQLADGSAADVHEPNACRFCSIGALLRVKPEGVGFTITDARRLLAAAVEELFPDSGPVQVFNDTHTHSEVLRVWDKAIENANR